MLMYVIFLIHIEIVCETGETASDVGRRCSAEFENLPKAALHLLFDMYFSS